MTEEEIDYKCDRCGRYETYRVCESCYESDMKTWRWQIGDFEWKINALWIAFGISLLVNFFLYYGFIH